MSHFRLCAAASLVALLLASWPVGSGATPQDKKTRGGVPQADNDTLMLIYGNDPDTINPITATDSTSGSFHRWVYETFAERRFSNPDVWDPLLAESWEFDEKSLTYTLHLRKGVKWHPMKLPDGTPLPSKEFTSADVKFTFDCILNPAVAAAHIRCYYEDPEAKEEEDRIKIAVEVIDKYTVKITWKKPYFLADDFTIGIAPIPKHVFSVDKEGEPISLDFSSKEFADGFNNHWANSNMCGTGPMKFVEWKKNERLVADRNPDYWGAPFFFNKVVFRSIANPNTALQMLLQGEVDSAGIGEKNLYVETKSHKNVLSGKVTLDEYTQPVYRYMGYNFARPFFQDKRVRKAIGQAIPIDEIISKVLQGLAQRLSGPFLPGSTACDATLKPLPYDVDAARKLLDQAGWKDSDGDGIRDMVVKGDKVQAKFEIIIYADSPQYRTIAEIIKENLRMVGVSMDIAPCKWALMLAKLRKKEFDVCLLGWAMGWKDDPFQLWHGSQAGVDDSSNHIGYKNDEVDKAINELRVTFDAKRQAELYHQIHRLIYEDQPYTFLYQDRATGGHDSRLMNVNHYILFPCVDAREWYSQTPRIIK